MAEQTRLMLSKYFENGITVEAICALLIGASLFYYVALFTGLLQFRLLSWLYGLLTPGAILVITVRAALIDRGLSTNYGLLAPILSDKLLNSKRNRYFVCEKGVAFEIVCAIVAVIMTVIYALMWFTLQTPYDLVIPVQGTDIYGLGVQLIGIITTQNYTPIHIIQYTGLIAPGILCLFSIWAFFVDRECERMYKDIARKP